MKIKKNILICSALISMVLALCACGTQSFSAKNEGPDFNTIEQTGSLNLEYATGYSVDYYGDYKFITIGDDSRFIVVPKDKDVPYNLPDNTVVLKQPLTNVYQVSSSSMDMIRAIGALDNVRLTGTKENDWYIEEVKDALEGGSLIYAGKYNQPDYELILKEGCKLAVENTMIWHNPEAKEKLEALGIPVIVETSNYESHPLGKLEWIKLYGVLFEKEEEAKAFFDEQAAIAETITGMEKSGKTVAFFYITSNGAVNVKKPGDYVPKMVELAGGKYLPQYVEIEEENAFSSINMTMEDFYVSCKDADFIIYNSTTVGDLKSAKDLLAKSPLFEDFKAYKENQVYLTGNNFYQETTGVCYLIEDMNKIFGGDDSNLHFLTHLN